ncbi:hypothetical protein NKR23_g711 [Pleurostoma richardsiae]|uniref:Uncharacterized protein n=1 Tax=Pleurostoma richardsiae TaxID=41990 RepID=A0AA38VLE1_9PEZI|nr:hypothetical protein NKR23_g711 [Pleurostoma richardsiae]
MLARLIFLDTYTTTGGQETGLDMSMGSEEISQLEFRLRKLLRRLEEPQSDSWVNVDIGLSKLLKGKAVDLGA